MTNTHQNTTCTCSRTANRRTPAVQPAEEINPSEALAAPLVRTHQFPTKDQRLGPESDVEDAKSDICPCDPAFECCDCISESQDMQSPHTTGWSSNDLVSLNGLEMPSMIKSRKSTANTQMKDQEMAENPIRTQANEVNNDIYDCYPDTIDVTMDPNAPVQNDRDVDEEEKGNPNPGPTSNASSRLGTPTPSWASVSKKPTASGLKQTDEDPEWVTLGSIATHKRRRKEKMSNLTVRADSPAPSDAATFVSEVSYIDSVATEDTGFSAPKGAFARRVAERYRQKHESGLARIKAEQENEKIVVKEIDQLLFALDEDNVDATARQLNSLIKRFPDLERKSAALVVHSQKPALEANRNMSLKKERAEERGGLLALLIVTMLEQGVATENFGDAVRDECMTECRQVPPNPPPKFSVASLIGNLHLHGIVEDSYIHQCTQIMLQPCRRSHVQAITMMLDRCTPTWKHIERLVFPHGHYDMLRQQAQDYKMGKPTYMGVKKLAQRKRPSWIDRQEAANERKREKQRARQQQRQANQQGWQNWAKAPQHNNRAPSEASTRRSRSRSRRTAVQSPQVQVRDPSPTWSIATLPIDTPIPMSNRNRPSDAASLSFENVEMPRESAFSLVEMLNKAPSILGGDAPPGIVNTFEPAPMASRMDSGLSVNEEMDDCVNVPFCEPMDTTPQPNGWSTVAKKQASSKSKASKKSKKSRGRRGKRGQASRV